MLDIIVVLPAGTIERSPLLNCYAGKTGALRTQSMGETRRITLAAHPEPGDYVADLPRAERDQLNQTAHQCWSDLKGSSESTALLIIGHPSPLSGQDNGIAPLVQKQYYCWFSHGDDDSRDLFRPLAEFLTKPDEATWNAILSWCWLRSSESPYVKLRLLASALDPDRSFTAWQMRVAEGREALWVVASRIGGKLAEVATSLGDTLDAMVSVGEWPEAKILAQLKREVLLLQSECREPQDEWF